MTTIGLLKWPYHYQYYDLIKIKKYGDLIVTDLIRKLMNDPHGLGFPEINGYLILPLWEI